MLEPGLLPTDSRSMLLNLKAEIDALEAHSNSNHSDGLYSAWQHFDDL